MNILLVSQCDKRALGESRRIIDQFAERRGERTWQTPITMTGLDTLRRLLKKTARKNTAVACHWIRGRDHSELLWIVGDASRFNAQGAVPTNTTEHDILRKGDENDWHSGEDIRLLTTLAALLHDLGKACRAFQERLLPGAPAERNQYRHEWVSLRLFQAFVGTDDDLTWLTRLANPSAADNASWFDRLQRDGLDVLCDKPFAHLPPLASALGWLVLTHHRLPVMPASDTINDQQLFLGRKVPAFSVGHLSNLMESIDAGWNEQRTSADGQQISAYWEFPHGLPVTTNGWRERAAKQAQRLIRMVSLPGHGDWLSNPYVMHLARLSLMLADHHYSSLTEPLHRIRLNPGYPLFANTDRKTGKLNQTLDEHLLGVEAHSAKVCHALAGFERQLPRLARHRGLKKRSADARFRWQDKAADLAVGMREQSAAHGAFIVNMASTGCGKTLANARIMYALNDPERGMRCAFALGLRSLTLQTGRAFRDLLGLGEDDLAIRVGGAASRELFEHQQEQAESSGSASTQSLLDEDSYVRFEGNADADPLLRRVIHEPQVRALLAAPVLVCTVDYLTPATEAQRGGRQIAPMLRLMSGDLVLDEPDDFDLADLPALTRLVHWAGLLGARVLLSSATLPPALLKGLFEAYLDGRRQYQRNRGQTPGEAPRVTCAWIDEHRQTRQDCAEIGAFEQANQAFAEQRHAWLGSQPVRRRAHLIPLALPSAGVEEQHEAFADLVRETAIDLHRTHHSLDPRSAKRVSFGLVRMANIEPLYEVAQALFKKGAPDGLHIHLCAYHSQYPLLLRSAIEQRLDAALNRRQPDAVFDIPDIRKRLDRHSEADHLFIVLGSPVTEVGRDHDYDWAVVEPSSMRSLIQLAGRVRRHRHDACVTPNLALLDSNLRNFKHPGKPAFCKPGFESEGWMLSSHRLGDLLTEQEREVIDARPRILARPATELRPRHNLVDLEHARLGDLMSPPAAEATENLTPRQRARLSGHFRAACAPDWWLYPQAHLTFVLQQHQPFREDNLERVDLALLPNEEGDDYRLTRIDVGKRKHESIYVTVDGSQNHRIPNEALVGPGICAWGETDYLDALTLLAGELDLPLEDCAKRFGTLSLSANESGWRFHPALGFAGHK